MKTGERTSAASGEDSRRITGQRILLACGIVSSVLYVAVDVFASMRFAGYSYAHQSFSELLALGAPSRQFLLPVESVYNILVIAFAAGVWRAATGNRRLRITAGLLAAYGLASAIGPFVPMHLRGDGASLTDALHITCTVVIVFSTLLAMGFGASALGKGFRNFSIATFSAVLVFGVAAGAQGGRIAAGDATPWLGIIERGNIYAIMLWILVLGVVLLRADLERARSAPKGRRYPRVV